MSDTLGHTLSKAIKVLQHAGVEGARKDAELLMAYAIERGRPYIMAYPEHRLSHEQATTFKKLITRRTAREPVSRIIGKREFWSLEFEISTDTLDPRPDTETLIDVALTKFPDGVDRFIDLGTGSGCIAIALLTEWPTARAIATDINQNTLNVAGRNACFHGVSDRFETRLGSWLEPISERVPLIISNPPYIGRQESLSPEVDKYDPHCALFADHDGLAHYKHLWKNCRQNLAPNGHLVMEMGWKQAKANRELAQHAGFSEIEVYKDLANLDRVITAQLK